MAISKAARSRYERFGLRAVRNDLASGGVTFVGTDKASRAEAQEWVDEQLAHEIAANEKARRSDASLLKWAIIGTVAVFIAAVAAIILLSP